MSVQRTSFLESETWFYRTFILGSIVSLLLSYGAHIFLKEWTFVEHLLRDLGMAGLIAMVLIYTVDRVSRERHENAAHDLMEKMNHNLFHAIYKRYIPPAVMEEVEKCLMKSDVFRTHYCIDYTLDYISEVTNIEQADKDKYLKCEIYSKYRLRNITDKPITHLVETHVELPIENSLKDLVDFDEITIDGDSLSAEEIKESTSTNDIHKIIKHEVTIPADGFKEVTMMCHTIKRKLDMEVWSSRFPSAGLTLRITAPSAIKVHATANHSEELSESKMGGGKLTIWELDHGMFPFQSVIFWWNAEE
jgi:hypothetical protein